MVTLTSFVVLVLRWANGAPRFADAESPTATGAP